MGRATPPSRDRLRRQVSRLRGMRAEVLAASMLVAKGYRVIAVRWASHVGEIDLIAARGRFIVFVEVKQRRSFEEAENSVGAKQRQRVRRAAELWLSRRPKYQAHEIRFDLVLVVPWRMPRHVIGGL